MLPKRKWQCFVGGLLGGGAGIFVFNSFDFWWLLIACVIGFTVGFLYLSIACLIRQIFFWLHAPFSVLFSRPRYCISALTVLAGLFCFIHWTSIGQSLWQTVTFAYDGTVVSVLKNIGLGIALIIFWSFIFRSLAYLKRKPIEDQVHIIISSIVYPSMIGAAVAVIEIASKLGADVNAFYFSIAGLGVILASVSVLFASMSRTWIVHNQKQAFKICRERGLFLFTVWALVTFLWSWLLAWFDMIVYGLYGLTYALAVCLAVVVPVSAAKLMLRDAKSLKKGDYWLGLFVCLAMTAVSALAYSLLGVLPASDKLLLLSLSLATGVFCGFATLAFQMAAMRKYAQSGGWQCFIDTSYDELVEPFFQHIGRYALKVHFWPCSFYFPK